MGAPDDGRDHRQDRSGRRGGRAALIEALHSERVNGEVKEAAIGALGAIGPQAHDAIPQLNDILRHKQWTIPIAAADALRLITGEDFGEDQDARRAWWDAQP